MPRETVHVLAIFVAAPGREAELESALSAMVEPTRNEAGCIRYDLTRALDGSGEFAFIEEWETVEDLNAHGRSEHIRVWGAKA
ncbi:MAG TPA: putative quinol monooxygenase, partial [Thermoanaerobaculia bacterium]